ncbi:glycosyltransferase involved in cell wall biosynthesis [Humitalea rosea]|uniref:Glycosyltransferase involved in cell wall biosynthesis n=1 Tax=Humitalea rosea TaxID=990373 RepID=A0A2W7IAC1_9PROT|nr:glycosyltransferase [Humitalea rosea]PZW43068.1 glycosyltransferase involved in cell wall biosynthesis [Humitalea rosea]
MISPAARLLVLAPEAGDHRARAFCLGAPAGWQVTLLTPLPGQRPTATETRDGEIRELRIGVEIPPEGRLAAAGIAGDAMLFGLAAAAARPGPLRRQAEALADAADLVLHLSPWSASLLARPPAEIYAPRGLMLAAALAGLQGDRLGEAWERIWQLEAALCGRARLVLAPGAAAAAGLGLLFDLPPARLRDAALGLRAEDAALPPPLPAGRRLCLAVNDYAIGGGRSGGAIRSRAMLDGLGRDTLLLTLGDQPAVTPLAPRLLEVVVPRGAAQRVAMADLRALAPAPMEDVLAAAHVGGDAALRRLLASLAPRAEALVFEQCYMAPLLTPLRRAAGPVPVIYHAHNLEAALKRDLLGAHPLAAVAVEAAGGLERELALAADLVLCCSEEDAAALRALGGQAQVLMVPHDALLDDGPPEMPAPEGPPRIGFIGSPHPPNRDAARFIRDVLAPALPNAVFEIVGGVCDSLPPGGPPNLRLHGVLAPEAMRAVLGGWRIALNPVAHGGGSSVKLADYLAQGLPVVSTPHGARGSMIAAAGAGILAEREAFVPVLAALLEAPARRDTLAAAARAWWASPARTAPLRLAQEALAALLAVAPPPRPPRHLLVLGSAATEAEAAVLAGTLDGLRPGFDAVDVLLPADLPPGLEAMLCAAATRSLRLPSGPPPPPVPPRQMLVAREEAAILRGFVPGLAGAAPLGLSGLLPPDAAEGRGLAPGFALLLPPGTGWVQLAFAAPAPLRLRLAVAAQDFGLLDLPGTGRVLELELRPGPPGAPLLLQGEVFAADGTAPATGLRLRRLVCGAAGGGPIRAMPLDTDATRLTRAASPEAWLAAARQVAAARGEAERRLLRGAPAPTALAPWLAESLGRYVAVLVPLEAGALAAMLLDPARSPRPRRLGLTLAADAGGGILPEAEASLLAHTDRALLARPGPWPVARGGVLRGFAALRQEAASARHLAAARAALGLERPWLLAAHLTGGMPAGQALHALAAAAGVDLVLAGDGQALRIAPSGRTQSAPIAFAALLCAAAPVCLGLWLPDPVADERALIALAWSVGVPVAADAGNPFARDALGADAEGPARLLADAGLRARLVQAGQARLAAWEQAHATWAD